jgi:hypothetical protein
LEELVASEGMPGLPYSFEECNSEWALVGFRQRTMKSSHSMHIIMEVSKQENQILN